MKSEKANELISKILKQTESKGIDVEKLVPMIKELREFALEEQDPLVTRTMRLTWQHLEENGGFELQILEDSESQDENLSYLIELFAKSDNKYNRDEIREITNNLQELA